MLRRRWPPPAASSERAARGISTASKNRRFLCCMHPCLLLSRSARHHWQRGASFCANSSLGPPTPLPLALGFAAQAEHGRSLLSPERERGRCCVPGARQRDALHSRACRHQSAFRPGCLLSVCFFAGKRQAAPADCCKEGDLFFLPRLNGLLLVALLSSDIHVLPFPVRSFFVAQVFHWTCMSVIRAVVLQKGHCHANHVENLCRQLYRAAGDVPAPWWPGDNTPPEGLLARSPRRRSTLRRRRRRTAGRRRVRGRKAAGRAASTAGARRSRRRSSRRARRGHPRAAGAPAAAAPSSSGRSRQAAGRRRRAHPPRCCWRRPHAPPPAKIAPPPARLLAPGAAPGGTPGAAFGGAGAPLLPGLSAPVEQRGSSNSPSGPSSPPTSPRASRPPSRRASRRRSPARGSPRSLNSSTRRSPCCSTRTRTPCGCAAPCFAVVSSPGRVCLRLLLQRAF